MPAIFNWFLSLLLTNPICMRLVQGGSRRRRHLLIRAGYLALMMITLLLALIGPSVSLRELAQRGANAFTIISFGQVGLICLLTPIFMAGAIAQEANQRTWDILLTTPLNGLQIVLGNLFGRLFFILALLVSTLPLFAITQYFGGVPGSSIFLSYLIAGSSAMVVAAVAVTLSVTRTAGRRAVFAFYISVIIYLFVTYAVDQYLRPMNPLGIGQIGTFTTWMTPLNPFLSLEALLLANSYSPHDIIGGSWFTRLWLGSPVAAFCWLSLLLSFFLIVFSTMRLRVIGARIGSVPLYRRLLKLGSPQSQTRAPRRVGTNPISWREAHLRTNSLAGLLGRWGFLVIGLIIALVIFALFHAGSITPAELRLALVTVIGAEICIIVLTALNLSGTAVSREREDGTLDLILTTPIQPGPYLAGKLKGLVMYLFPMLVLPILTLMIGSIYVLSNGLGSGNVQTFYNTPGAEMAAMPILLPESAIIMPLVLIPFIAFCLIIGMHWSIRSKGTIGSVAASVAIVVVIILVLGLCGGSAGMQIPFVGAALNALSPINLLLAGVEPSYVMYGSLERPDQARISLVVGALIACGIYVAIVYAMHSNMKRSFMTVVRRLAGTN